MDAHQAQNNAQKHAHNVRGNEDEERVSDGDDDEYDGVDNNQILNLENLNDSDPWL